MRTSIPQLPLSKKLVTIKTDLDLPLDLHELALKPVDNSLLIELTRELEFKTWLKELLGQEEGQGTSARIEPRRGSTFGDQRRRSHD